jgi:hypothetical protein
MGYPAGLFRIVIPSRRNIEGIAAVPPNKLKNMSFPDIIANAQKSVEDKDLKAMRSFSREIEKQRFEQLEAAPTKEIEVQQILNGPLPDPKFLLEKGVDRVVDLGNDGVVSEITNPVVHGA